nr:MAG TPA: YopX protein [Caudoviricetes sp.]
MDRYLYKAKRLDNGEWVQGNLIQSCDATDGWEAIIIPTKNSNMFTKHIKRGYGNLGFENWYRVDPSTICQCTGLKDKNGKLIWENDIVWDSDERTFYEIIWNQEDMCWNVEDADGHKSEFEECYGSTIEVNGNRFDNSELLESEG